MKKLMMAVAGFFVAVIVSAASVDGKWKLEAKANFNGQERTFEQTLTLKAAGAAVTGTVEQPGFGGGPATTVEIKDGKLDGDKFTFSVTRETPNGEFKSIWEGTVNGDAISGTQKFEQVEFVITFTGKKQP